MIVTLYPVLACIVHCKDVCVHQMKLRSILLMILGIQSSITRYKQHEEVRMSHHYTSKHVYTIYVTDQFKTVRLY